MRNYIISLIIFVIQITFKKNADNDYRHVYFYFFVYDLFTDDKFISILLSITFQQSRSILVNILDVYLYEKFYFLTF